MYIAIEGIDTAGKSTQIAALKAIFPQAIFTQEPSQDFFGTQIRKLVLDLPLCSLAETFLFLANRAQHMHDVIKPNNNKLIISDRSLISGIAYAKDISNEDVHFLNRLSTQGIYPQKVFLLFLDSQSLQERLSEKQTDKIEQRGTQYLLQIQDNMINACEKLGIDLVQIDARSEKEKITQMIAEEIKNV